MASTFLRYCRSPESVSTLTRGWLKLSWRFARGENSVSVRHFSMVYWSVDDPFLIWLEEYFRWESRCRSDQYQSNELPTMYVRSRLEAENKRDLQISVPASHRPMRPHLHLCRTPRDSKPLVSRHTSLKCLKNTLGPPGTKVCLIPWCIPVNGLAVSSC
jgi:hypothetical protein